MSRRTLLAHPLRMSRRIESRPRPPGAAHRRRAATPSPAAKHTERVSLTPPPTCLDALPPIQRTLAIPLVGRARAHAAFPRIGFRDPVAESLVARTRSSAIERLGADRPSVWGSIVRTRVLDEVTRTFLADDPEGTVVTLGAGLCTRSTRIEAGRWVDLDVPEVIEARNALLPDPDALRIGLDLRDATRLTRVLEDVGTRRPTLVIAEGVLMFLEPATHHAVLKLLHDTLASGSRVAFDWIHPIVARLAFLNPSMRASRARYASGFLPSTLEAFPRFGPAPRLFEAALDRPRRLLLRFLSAIGRGSPPYEITCVDVLSSTDQVGEPSSSVRCF